MAGTSGDESLEQRVKALMNVDVLRRADDVEAELGDFLAGLRDAVIELAKEIDAINRWRAFR